VLSEFGELDPKHYLTGTDKNEVLVVDHVAHSATRPTGDAPAATPGAFESARLAVYAALKDYVDTQYAEGVAAVGVFETKDGLVAVISGVKTNLRNYWSGKWRSEWTIDPKGKTCSGAVHIVVHYFEDGNVQMEQAKTIEKAGVPGGDDKALAEGVKAFVAKSENAISEALETLYQNMSEESFKGELFLLPFVLLFAHTTAD
jgi:capping protein alpha